MEITIKGTEKEFVHLILGIRDDQTLAEKVKNTIAEELISAISKDDITCKIPRDKPLKS